MLATDNDLELILLDVELEEKHCEGVLHPTREEGHNDGPLFYCHMIHVCCGAGDFVMIICKGRIDDYNRTKTIECAECGEYMPVEKWFKVLEAV